MRLFICLASLLPLVLASCGDDSASPPVAATRENEGSEPTVLPSSRPNEVTRLSIDIGAGRRAAAIADPAISDEVKAVLADGIVTFSEYEASVPRMAQCVKDAGARFRTADQPSLDWRGLYTYTVGWPVASPRPDCVERHVGILDLSWKELTAPSEQEESAAMDKLAQCMIDIGLAAEVPQGRRREDFDALGPTLSEEARALYVSCAQRIGEEFALPYFAGRY